MNSCKRVLLGMSGGTDSSVAAILLREHGYEVVGITFRFLRTPATDVAITMAVVVAERLGIEHYVVDAVDAFSAEVLDYFVAEYMQGRTPFPCTRCNERMKWPLLFLYAAKYNCARVATGHYVRVVTENTSVLLAMGKDKDKDQSFFLWPLYDRGVDKVVFPLGEMSKAEVKAYAERCGFEKVNRQKESTGLCFCPDDYRPYLSKVLEIRNQKVLLGYYVDEKGNVLGEHCGYPFYTVGQRRGLGLQLNAAMYVKEICPDMNRVVLAPHSSLYKTEFVVRNVRFPYMCYMDDSRLWVRIRYRKQYTPCRVEVLENDRMRVCLNEPLDAVAPGQTAVFYCDEMVVGGGYIE